MVMEQGRIMERGTHEELMEKKGMYTASIRATLQTTHDSQKQRPGTRTKRSGPRRFLCSEAGKGSGLTEEQEGL